jgi:hypothetical protein
VLWLAAAALSAHDRGGGSGEQERPADVGFAEPVPDLRRERVKVAERDPDVPGRVVDQDVQSAEMIDELVGGGIEAGPPRRLAAGNLGAAFWQAAGFLRR